MDKTTGFALLGFLFIVLAASLAPRSGGGASPLPGVSAAGGGGGGGDVCTLLVGRFRMCALQQMDEIPAAYRDRALEEFEGQLGRMQAECSAEAAAEPAKAAAIGQCLQLTDCDAIEGCIRAAERQ